METQLQRIMDAAKTMQMIQQEIARLNDALDLAKQQYARLEQQDLPELMREIGLTSFVLEDGSKIDLVDDVSCAITQENQSAAMKWLDANGFGGLIKTQLKVFFNREDRSSAVELSENLLHKAQDLGVSVDQEIAETVHASTLKSFVKEQLAAGNNIPFDLFSIHTYSKVKIKNGKK